MRATCRWGRGRSNAKEDLSTKEETPKESAWFSGSNEHQRRSACLEGPSAERTQAPGRLTSHARGIGAISARCLPGRVFQHGQTLPLDPQHAVPASMPPWAVGASSVAGAVLGGQPVVA